MFFFFFKQKTAYEMRISDWSSDVCSSDLVDENGCGGATIGGAVIDARQHDQPTLRRQAEGQRQQDGNGHQRPDTWQQSDERPERDADQAVHEVHWVKGDPEAKSGFSKKPHFLGHMWTGGLRP